MNPKPLKRLGQNFLTDKKIVKKIIKAAELGPEDVVLEIGPGLGVLTKELAKIVKKVIAVEKDPRLVETLKENLKEFKNVEIVLGDILKLKFQIPMTNAQTNPKSQIPKKFKIQNSKFKIVANLPFYIAAPTIRKFLEIKNQPEKMVLMVQKEVAQRICSKPPRMSVLAVSVQFYAKPEIISYVSKNAFSPRPKVDAAILRIAPRIDADFKRIDTDLFFKVVRAGFSQPRKQLANNLANGLKLNKEQVKSWLLKNNIQTTQRAENLSLEDWINLTNTKLVSP